MPGNLAVWRAQDDDSGVKPPRRVTLSSEPPMLDRDATIKALTRTSRRLSRAVDAMGFSPPVAYTYNPLAYARAPHEAYLAYANCGVDALFLGMNPGPFGMAQTGVPFGEVAAVRRFLSIDAKVGRPSAMHPKRPIEGFACTRSEVSGRRFWGLIEEEFVTPTAFFERAFVWNWCPLAFMSESGANITPEKLAREDRAPLVAACDEALACVVTALKPRIVIGVGAFASASATRALGSTAPLITTILHPSPASPAANRGWTLAARRMLVDCGVFPAGSAVSHGRK
jgi:single-strand selective monofunctional uracil DNA glycosylase